MISTAVCQRRVISPTAISNTSGRRKLLVAISPEVPPLFRSSKLLTPTSRSWLVQVERTSTTKEHQYVNGSEMKQQVFAEESCKTTQPVCSQYLGY